MSANQIPLELVSNFLSIIILIALFFKYYQYKKKLEVIKGLDKLKEENSLTQDDKDFIKINLKDYRQLLEKDEQRLKLAYPILILTVGILLAFLPFSAAAIHLNIVVVVYIYLHVGRIHNRNFVKFLQELNNNLD